MPIRSIRHKALSRFFMTMKDAACQPIKFRGFAEF